MTTTIDTIRTEIDACIAAAREQGYDGTDAEYEHTAEDLESVIEALGRKPTPAEWGAAGMPHVGGDHCSAGGDFRVWDKDTGEAVGVYHCDDEQEAIGAASAEHRDCEWDISLRAEAV